MSTFEFRLTKKNTENKNQIKHSKNPPAEELKVVNVFWLKHHKPEVLLYKVEKVVEDAGGKVLWMRSKKGWLFQAHKKQSSVPTIM